MEQPREGEIFPWNDVEAARQDQELQEGKDPAEARDTYGGHADACPECGRPAADLDWIYFRSPPWTWEKLVGREGWLTVCPDCRRQVDFFVTVMN